MRGDKRAEGLREVRQGLVPPMDRRTVFNGRLLPVVLVAPQLLLTGFFFYCRRERGVVQHDYPGCLRPRICLFRHRQFRSICSVIRYTCSAIVRTVMFCLAVSVLAMGIALGLAVFADREIAGRGVYGRC